MNQRILLPTALQKELFVAAKNAGKFSSWKQFAQVHCLNYSALKNYKNAKRTVPQNLFSELARKLDKHKRNTFITQLRFLEANWGAVKGGIAGMQTVKQKYGAA